jgi:hypothetical protein
VLGIKKPFCTLLGGLDKNNVLLEWCNCASESGSSSASIRPTTTAAAAAAHVFAVKPWPSHSSLQNNTVILAILAITCDNSIGNT